ncbi:hypothetical protein SAMD00019534_112600 [Acytostelium subglobosum LB1]|uniref:hypothetical protein n=1 Tax=Acytostelium subglobosum LB1 TaxID=1410327 RepID=UPI0006449410|nr:hypothetical protein SAMD00019534_112600 [Acytostelium subglobosum LB1]GAM28084.1 hypothetical protein SAMD00019534_112600 [Acytostelium subglobosum LB1]|eukprot:XP_012749043.1 hypothetical protein SAMD00019534_112600 [Acytostelium subglobosum LB1]
MNNIKQQLTNRKKVTPGDELYRTILSHSDTLDELQKNFERQQQQFFTSATQSKQLADALKRYGETASGFNSRIPLHDCMQRASEWQNSLSDCFNHLGNVLYDRTTQPLKETIRIQVDVVKDAKHKLKKLTPTGDVNTTTGGGASSQPTSPPTSSALKSTPDSKREQDIYDRARKETALLYGDSELALENSAIQTILSAYEAYSDFFQKGAFQMARIKVDIDNYRKVILETNRVAAKLRNYIPRKTFGVKLEEVFARESTRPIPVFLEEIFQYLEKSAPAIEGIFRVGAGKSSIEMLQQKIEMSQPLDLHTILDPHVVSSVLKLFFRSLPEPVVHYTIYQHYLSVSKLPSSEHIPQLRRLVSSLPVANQVILRNVLSLCNTIRQSKEVTKMDVNNLAVVLGPALLEPIPNLTVEDIQKPETFAEFNALFILMIENHHSIFPSQSVNSELSGRIRAFTESVIPPKLNSELSRSNQDLSRPILLSPPIKSATLVQQQHLAPSTAVLETSATTPSSMLSGTTSPMRFNTPRSAIGSPEHNSSYHISLTPDSSHHGAGGGGNHTSPNRKKSMMLSRQGSDFLKPIDMQIHFMNITSNFTRLKTIVDNTNSTEQGIHLIKLFKKLSDISISIQKITRFAFTRDRPVIDQADDKLTKAKKTLVYTYENNIDLIKDAKDIYESCEDINVSKELERFVAQFDTCILEELDAMNKQLQQQ